MEKLTTKQLTKIVNTQQNQIQSLLNIINAYIDFKGDGNKFAESVKEKLIQTHKHDHHVTIRSIQRKNLWHEIHLVGYQTSAEASIALKQLLANYPSISQDKPYILSLLKP